MNLIQAGIYDPWRAVNRLHSDVNGFLPRRFFSSPKEASRDAEWLPAVDIREEDERFVIRADVPGVDPTELNVTVDRNVLSLHGTRETRPTEDGGGLRRAERVRGQFRRSFSLPDSADLEGVAADYRDGVLEVTVPKQRELEPRRVEISTSRSGC